LFQENDIGEFHAGKYQQQQKWQADGRFNRGGTGPGFRVIPEMAG
jgi:hypothetical protein